MWKVLSNLCLVGIISLGGYAKLVGAHGMGLVQAILLCGTHVLLGEDGSRCYELLCQPQCGLPVLCGLDPLEI